MPRKRRSDIFEFARRSDRRVQRVSWGQKLVDVAREIPLDVPTAKPAPAPLPPPASPQFEQSRSQHLSDHSSVMQSLSLELGEGAAAAVSADGSSHADLRTASAVLAASRAKAEAKARAAADARAATAVEDQRKLFADAGDHEAAMTQTYLPGTAMYYGSEICLHSMHSGYLAVDARGGCYMSETLTAETIFTIWNLSDLSDFGIVRYGDHVWLQINKNEVLGTTVMMDVGRHKSKKKKQQEAEAEQRQQQQQQQQQQQRRRRQQQLQQDSVGSSSNNQTDEHHDHPKQPSSGGGGGDPDPVAGGAAGRPVAINSRAAHLKQAKLLGNWVMVDPFSPTESAGNSVTHMDAITFEQGWLFLASDGTGPVLKRRGGPEFGSDVDRQHFSGVWRVQLYSGSSGMTNDQLVLIEARNQLRNSEGGRERARRRKDAAADALDGEIDQRERKWRSHLVSEEFSTDSGYFGARYVHTAGDGWRLNPNDLLTSAFQRRNRALRRSAAAAGEPSVSVASVAESAVPETSDEDVDEEGDEDELDPVVRARGEAMAMSAEARISADVWNEILQQDAQLDTFAAAQLEAVILIQRRVRKFLADPWRREFRGIDKEVTSEIVRKIAAKQEQDAFAAKFNAEFEAEKQRFLAARRKRNTQQSAPFTPSQSSRSLRRGLGGSSSSVSSSTSSLGAGGGGRRRARRARLDDVPELSDAEKLVVLQYCKPEVFGAPFSEEVPRVLRAPPQPFVKLDELTVGGRVSPLQSPRSGASTGGAPPPRPRRAQSASALHARKPPRRRPGSGGHTVLRPVKSFLPPQPLDENGLTPWRALVSRSRPSSAARLVVGRMRPASAMMVRTLGSALGSPGSPGSPGGVGVGVGAGAGLGRPASAAPRSTARPGSAAPRPMARPTSAAPSPVPSSSSSSASAGGARPGSAAPRPNARPGSAAPRPMARPTSAAPSPVPSSSSSSASAGGARPGSAAPRPNARPSSAAPRPMARPTSAMPRRA